MTDILCDWLNREVQLSVPIHPDSFEKEFANGYLIGEVLHKYELQDDFERFSRTKASESKINNFTRVEPVLHLLGVPFDTNTARSVMTEEPGVATRLMYQLFIALENKRKANLTGVAMETMRPAAPAKLQSMESLIYRQRLKQVTPRQTDLNLKELIDKFHQHQVKLEERALKGRIESAEAHRREHQEHRQRQLQRSKQLQVLQSEQIAKIQAAIVQIPKPPPNRTAAAMEARREQRRRAEADAAMSALDVFEEKLSRTLQPAEPAQQRPGSSSSTGASRSGDSPEPSAEQLAAAAAAADATSAAATPAEQVEFVKPASNDAYVSKIRRRLAEDAEARAAREKRRRKVLVDCLRAHEQQEEQLREAQLANKLMRQSQMERRIAVQLLQARREKDTLKRNRYERERQYQQRREAEFREAMDREQRLAKEAKEQYAEQLDEERRLHDEAAGERRRLRYEKHFAFCSQVVGDLADFACRVAEYRQLDGGRLPRRKYRDLAAVFVAGQPLYDLPPQQQQQQQQLLRQSGGL